MIDVVVMLFVMVFVPVIVELVVAEAVAVVVACSMINRWLIVGVVGGDGERFELNVH